MPKIYKYYSDRSESKDRSDEYSMLPLEAIDTESSCKSDSGSSSNSLSIRFAADIIII
jgi:hypothetical protein